LNPLNIKNDSGRSAKHSDPLVKNKKVTNENTNQLKQDLKI